MTAKYVTECDWCGFESDPSPPGTPPERWIVLVIKPMADLSGGSPYFDLCAACAARLERARDDAKKERMTR